MMPRFFKDMPPRRRCWCQVTVFKTSLRGRTSLWQGYVFGLRRAYLEVRLRALLLPK
jgi:hypothetical protein